MVSDAKIWISREAWTDSWRQGGLAAAKVYSNLCGTNTVGCNEIVETKHSASNETNWVRNPIDLKGCPVRMTAGSEIYPILGHQICRVSALVASHDRQHIGKGWARA